MLNKIFGSLLSVFFLSTALIAQNDTLSTVVPSNDSVKTNSQFYLSWHYFNAYRSFEDNTVNQIYEQRLNEEAINTQGLEFGTYMDLTKNLNVGLGLGFHNGGETYTFDDPDTDSSFTYTNKYRQVSLPIRLHYQLGTEIQPFGFVGIIPSSILGRKYESSYTDTSGILIENDPEIFKDNLNAFQFVGTAGLGIKFNFDNTSFFVMGEYRQYFTNTYTGLFLTHFQRLIGGSAGLSFRF